MITVYLLHIVCTNTLMVHIFFFFFRFVLSGELLFTFWLGKSRQHSDFGFSVKYFHFHISCSLCRDIYLCMCQQIIKNLLCSFQNTVYFFSRSIKLLNVITSFFFLSLSVSTHPGERHGCVMKAQQQFFSSLAITLTDTINISIYVNFIRFYPSLCVPQWIIWVSWGKWAFNANTLMSRQQ